MYTFEELTNFIFIDIETVGEYETYEELRRNNTKKADLWDKRTDYLKERYPENSSKNVSEMYYEKSGLHSEFAKIACVSMASLKNDGGVSVASSADPDEPIIINKTLNVLKKFMGKSMNRGRISGHNIKRFDVPFLCKRSIINGIALPDFFQIHKMKPWEQPFVDTMEVWSHGAWQEKFVGLDLLTNVLGIDSPKDEMDAKEVHSKYYSGEMEEIKKYCEKDTVSTLKSLAKMSGIDI